VGKFKRNSGRRKQGCKEKEEPRREGWNLKKETQIQNQYQYQGEEHRGTREAKRGWDLREGREIIKYWSTQGIIIFFFARGRLKQCLVGKAEP